MNEICPCKVAKSGSWGLNTVQHLERHTGGHNTRLGLGCRYFKELFGKDAKEGVTGSEFWFPAPMFALKNTRARRVLRCEPSLQANCRSRCCCSSCLSINDHSCSTSNLTKRTSQSNNFTRFRAQGYYHQNINSRSSFSSRHFMRQDKIAYCEIKCCVSSRTKQGMQQKPSRQTYMTWMSE